MCRWRSRWCSKWLVLWSLWAGGLLPAPHRVLLPGGRGVLRGELARDGRHARFLGVPYAAYDARRRFQAPGPEPSWEGEFRADREHVRCAQPMLPSSEACLALNVYAPLSAARLPVMVYFHGGGFAWGSGGRTLYGPEFLVREGVILVTVNYRLGVEGFLCLGIAEAPGNAGLKDQVAALRWVRRNIEAFGGDPDDVTIFGESAGAASVSYHVLSPMSEGLFHKAILQSGSSLSPWAHQLAPIAVATELVKLLGYLTSDPYEIYDILNNSTASSLSNIKWPRREGDTMLANFAFVPCVERRIEGIEPFLTEDPFGSLATGKYNKVPMIIGSNREEGFFIMAIDEKGYSATVEGSLPSNLEFTSNEDRAEVVQILKDTYMSNDSEAFGNDVLKFSRFIGEVNFNYPAICETELIIETNDRPVYHYEFKYPGWRNVATLASNFLLGGALGRAPPATHGDDLFYLFNPFWFPILGENKMINRMTSMWTNFAKYSNPTPRVSASLPLLWPAAASGAPRMLAVDRELSVEPLGDTASIRLWRRIYRDRRAKRSGPLWPR